MHLTDSSHCLTSIASLLPTKKPSNADLPSVGLRSSPSLTDIFQYYSPTGSIRNSPNASPAISRSSSRATLLHSSHDDGAHGESTLLQSLTLDTLHEMTASLLLSTIPPARMITESAFGSFVPDSRATGDPMLLLQNIKHIFSSPGGMSSSFLATESTSGQALLLGVDMDEVREAYDILLIRLKHIPEVRDALTSATEILLARLEVTAPTWKWSRSGKGSAATSQQTTTAVSKKLRQIVLVMANPLLVDRTHSDILLRRFCVVMASLKRDVKGFLARKLSEYFCLHRSDFRQLVQTVKKYLCERYYPNNQSDDGVVAAVRALSLLYNVNELSSKLIKKERRSEEELQSSTLSIIPYSDFYCTVDAKDCRSISDRFHFKEEYLRWRRLNANPTSLQTEFSLLNYPFLFDPIAKSRVLRVESMSSMTSGFEMAFINNAFVTQAQRLLTGLETVESQSSKRSENGDPVASAETPCNVSESGAVPSRSDARREAEPRRSGSRTPLTSASIEAAFQGATNPYFVLEVRREHLIEDAIDQVIQCGPFANSQSIDYG